MATVYVADRINAYRTECDEEKQKGNAKCVADFAVKGLTRTSSKDAVTS